MGRKEKIGRGKRKMRKKGEKEEEWERPRL